MSPAEQAIVDNKEPPAEAPAQQQPAAEAPQQAEGEPQAEGNDRAATYVPVGELQKERNRRKEIERKARETEEKFQRLAGRLDVLQQAYQAQPPKAEQPQALPPVTEAPFDHIQAHERDLTEVKATLAARQQQEQQAAARQQFLGAVSAREAEYRATKPDYDAAVQHLRTDRVAEWMDAGYTQEQASAIVDGEAFVVAENALRAGRNPAEVWYNMATRRGYKGAAPQKPAQQLETIERGQQAGRSLSQAAGSAPPGNLTAQQILDMDEHEFSKLSERAWKKAMGG